MTDTIGHRIQLVRKNTGLSQVAFAKSLDLSQGFLSNLEKARYQPTPEILIRIASIYHVDANWLLIGTGEMKIRVDYNCGDYGGSTVKDQMRGYNDSIANDIIHILGDLDKDSLQDILKYSKEKKLLAEIQKTA